MERSIQLIFEGTEHSIFWVILVFDDVRLRDRRASDEILSTGPEGKEEPNCGCKGSTGESLASSFSLSLPGDAQILASITARPTTWPFL